jgi:hypothetical protein
MRVLLRGGMETWREDQCTSQLSAQPIIVTLLCPRPRTETNLHAHCQRWRARTHLMDGERAIFHTFGYYLIIMSSRLDPGKVGPAGFGRSAPHVIDILVSSSRISDLRARRYGAPLVAGRAQEPHRMALTHTSRPAEGRPLLQSDCCTPSTMHDTMSVHTRGGSSRRVTVRCG